MVVAMTSTPYTAADKEAWLELHTDSGLSAAAFCREHELPYQAFLQWKAQPDPHVGFPEFIEIETSASMVSITRQPIAELTLAEGITLRIFQPCHS
jgi:hypothetical protein